MTRKRRIQEDQNQNQGFHKRERFQRNERQQWNNGDGRQNDRNSGKGDGNNRGNYGRDDRNYGNNSGSDRNYERNDRNYGNDRNNDGNYGNNDGNYGDSGNYQSEARKEGKTEFPTALVRYLEQMARENPEEDMMEVFIDKCLEEVDGQEELLLHFVDSCLLVENIFTRSPKAAFEYLKKLGKFKKQQRLHLVFNRSAEKVLEKLVFKLAPFNNNHQELISSWIELMIDNWNDCASDQAASFFIRSMTKALCGVTLADSAQKSVTETVEKLNLNEKKVAKGWIKQELDRIYSRAFDYNTMKDLLIIPTVSLVLQDLCVLEKRAQTGQIQPFMTKLLAETENLFDSFSHRDSSRLWEQLVKSVDEQMRETLFQAFISDSFQEMATHPTANYVLKAFLEACQSEEITSEISSSFLEILPTLLEEQKLWIVPSALKLFSKFSDQQDNVVKSMRSLFNADKASTKINFLPNILCLNNGNIENGEDGLSFDLNQACVNGSIILKELFHFKKNKSLLTSFLALSSDSIVKASQHPVASHIFDGFFSSDAIETATKMEVFEKFNIHNLVLDKFGSRVFERFWFCTAIPVAIRENIVKQVFIPLLTSNAKNQYVYILISKLHVKEWRENSKKWALDLPSNLESGKLSLDAQFINKGNGNAAISTDNSWKKKKKKKFHKM